MAAIAAKAQAVAVRPAAKPAARVAPVADRKFRVWQPTDNKMFETFSYLPPLSDRQIAQQVDYMVANRQVPCLEFASADLAYSSNANTVRMGNVSCGYYDNRYWTLWKLPMFGCSDPNQVLREVAACTKAFPDAYVRLVSFDPNRQVQVSGFLVQRPASVRDWKGPEARSVGGDASSGRDSYGGGSQRKSYSYSW